MQTIREIRKSTGLSQTEFGRRLGGIPLRTIQNWENGVRDCPEYIVELIAYRVQHDPAFKKEKAENRVDYEARVAARNTNKQTRVEGFGEAHTVEEWAAKFGVLWTHLWQYLDRGLTVEGFAELKDIEYNTKKP